MSSLGKSSTRECDAADAPVIDRGAFYAAPHCAMCAASLASGTKRARRLAVRNAGLEVMQRFHVIERSRGGVPVPPPECEGIS